MEKRLLIIIAVLIVSVSSCSNPAVYYSVWQGNNLYASGEYQDATNSYLSALDKGVFSDYISYDLANVYYSLGEASAALKEWEKAALTRDNDLLFRTMYNKGVLEFESGRYQEAFELFKKALKIQPGNRNAKINLEYSLNRINSSANTAESSAAGAEVTEKKEITNEIQRVLDFIRKKESGSWKPNEEEGSLAPENDW
jgi:tetratricopeptide (TPR) repeat protein